MNKILAITLSVLLPLATVEGAIKEELNSFFDSCGSSTNSNSAAVYEGQKAGYCTGGGVVVRNRVMNSKIATVNLPKFDAGCGGIDMYMGGFSFISSEELVNTLKNISSSAFGYAFLLGMETVSPQISNNVKQLQSWANQMNGLSINSCEMATNLVGSVWPRNTAASQHICRSASTSGKTFQNYLQARHNCANNSGGNKNKELNYAETFDEEFNIAWTAINKHAFLAKNQSLAELFMTLTGTFVVRDDNGIKVGGYYPSKMTDESFLKTLLEGGKTTAYKCKDSERCFQIADQALEISPAESWTGKVRSHLLSIQNKILLDEELDQAEVDFIGASSLPLYRIVNVMTAYKGGNCPVDLYEISSIVAMDLLLKYLNEVLGLAREGCLNAKLVQAYSFNIDSYIAELNRLEDIIRRYELRSKDRMDQEFHLLQKIQTIEEQIAAEIVL
jgi:conjugative transfer pilus assembly protein TraH